MREDHRQIVAHFASDAHLYLVDYFDVSAKEIDALGFPGVYEEKGLGQADLVLALLRGDTPSLHAAAEELVGKAIQQLPPQPSRPLPAPVAKPEEPPADRRRVTRVGPNPRLPTTPSFQRFRLIKVGLTVGQLVRRGVTRRDIREALANQWLELTP